MKEAETFYINKVAEITLIFWLMKIVATINSLCVIKTNAI